MSDSSAAATFLKSFLKTGSFILWVLVFFLLLFFFERLFFVAFYFQEMYKVAGLVETSRVFYMPFFLDLSTAAYCTLIPFLLSLGLVFARKERGLHVIIKAVILVEAGLTILIHVGETVTYQEWKSKFSSRVFTHLAHPTELVRTATPAYLFEFAGMAAILLVISWLLYGWIVKRALPAAQSFHWKMGAITTIVSLLGYSFLLVVAVRGGLGRYPIGVSNGYFSNYYIVNDASVNTIWNFGDKWKRYRKGNLEKYFGKYPAEQAASATRELLVEDESSSVSVLKTKTPNIVFIVLESWSAQMISALGGVGAPNVSKIAAEGILFDRVYAASWTSQKGTASIFSGYPSLPRSPINQQDQKIRSLPSLPRSLPDYESSYYYGGDLDFGNIGGYLVNAGFGKLYDEDSLSELQPRGRLGAHDEATLPYFYDRLMETDRNKPFLYALFTLSSHSPYDIPGLSDWPSAGESAAYAATIAYADEHLGAFFAKVRKSDIYNNTLFILVADHGRTNEYNSFPYNDKMYHIPMIWWGGALREEAQGMRVSKIGAQYDIAATLLKQLDRETEGYIFGKDLLNPQAKGFAMYEHHNGYGWIDANGYFAFELDRNRVVEKDFSSEETFQKAFENSQAFVTAVYRNFLF